MGAMSVHVYVCECSCAHVNECMLHCAVEVRKQFEERESSHLPWMGPGGRSLHIHSEIVL